LTFGRLSTALSERDFRTLWGSMASLRSLSGLLRHYIIRAQAVSRRRSRHQEATGTSENCIYQISEHLEVSQIQPEDQVAHPELKRHDRAVVWSRNVEGDRN